MRRGRGRGEGDGGGVFFPLRTKVTNSQEERISCTKKESNTYTLSDTLSMLLLHSFTRIQLSSLTESRW